jgi:hypothetical protein
MGRSRLSYRPLIASFVLFYFMVCVLPRPLNRERVAL